MKAEISTSRHASTAGPSPPQRFMHANRLAEAVKRRWQHGEPPNVDDVLAHHPELRHYRSVVLDLAYAEYHQRRRVGEPIDAETFVRRFPSLEKSLYLLIEVHALLSHDPDLQLLQESLPWPEAGSRYLQFDLVAEIGRGTFGRVFLATEPALGGRQIVVKIAPSAGGEAEILGRLGHPNIVPVYSLYEDETTGLAAFCMPYLGRATLCDVLDQAFNAGRPPLWAQMILNAIAVANDDLDFQKSGSPAKILRKGSYVDGVIHLAGQLADALAHSHGRGIYHRDLKPSNVLMTPEGRPLLLDYNLSVDLHLPAWKVGGTLPYMAPEELVAFACQQSEFQSPHYDPRSDLFSLGVIVYELLTGRLPFGAMPRDCSVEEAARQLREQQAAGPQPIRELNCQVDQYLARLMKSCLAFEPERRPETAEQLAAAFRRELSLARRTRRWIGNHRGLVAGMGAAVLSLSLAGILFLSLRPPYSVRQLQCGLTRIEQGDYAAAVDYLSDSIRSNPDSSEALFTRGRAYHRLGEFQLAFQDYTLANRLESSPMLNACRGYCLSRVKSYKAAIAMYDLALKAGHDRPAFLHNNIGYSYLMLGQLANAEKHLQRAAELDGNLQAAHYNLVLLFLYRAFQGHTIPSEAFVHAAKAIEIGPHSADLYRYIAALYAMAAKHDPAWAKPAISCVGKAIELGSPQEVFTSDVCYSALKKDPVFYDVLKKTPSGAKVARAAQLIDPLDKLQLF